MDRSVMEGNPHAVLDGLLIAGKAVGADGVVCAHAEYPLAVQRMRGAIEAAENTVCSATICSRAASLPYSCRRSAGAFVCGEETTDSFH